MHGKVAILPLGFPTLKRDLEVYVVGRAPDEYLLHPKKSTHGPMSTVGVHKWFKRALERAGMPPSVQMHELRHSAGDNLRRATGDVELARKLLSHENLATTATYLHSTREDLEAALASLDEGVLPARAIWLEWGLRGFQVDITPELLTSHRGAPRTRGKPRGAGGRGPTRRAGARRAATDRGA